MSTSDLPSRRYGPYELVTVWPQPSEVIRQKVMEFWKSNGVFDDSKTDDAERRSQQLLVVAQGDDGVVAAVSTAVKMSVKQLGFPCFYYRTFVGDEHRKLWMLSMELFLASYHVLNERFKSGNDPDVLALFMELQNESLMKRFKYAVWDIEGMNVVYIGKSPQGLHWRIWYFDDAVVP